MNSWIGSIPYQELTLGHYITYKTYVVKIQKKDSPLSLETSLTDSLLRIDGNRATVDEELAPTVRIDRHE